MTRRTRWTCPTGTHPGQLGPKHPRKDAVVRYCWPCSLTAGRLVKRIAPALERKKRTKAEAQERAKTLAKERREAAHRAAAAKRELRVQAAAPAPPTDATAGLDWIRAERARLGALPFAASNRGSGTRRRVRARDTSFGCRFFPTTQPWNDASRVGHHWQYQNRITVTVGPKASRALCSELVMHELVHAACPTEQGVNGRNIYHGRTFREWLVRAAREAYGLEISPTAAGRSAYKLDSFIVAALEAADPAMREPLGKGVTP